MQKKVNVEAVAPQALEGTRSATGSACGAADEAQALADGVNRADLAGSPFTGEDHRKVWARLRILHDLRASCARVLRLMRDHQLRSPHRKPQGEPNLHDGRITTDTPNEMWGTDGARIQTVKDGMVWIFSAVDLIAMVFAPASIR